MFCADRVKGRKYAPVYLTDTLRELMRTEELRSILITVKDYLMYLYTLSIMGVSHG